MPFTAATDHLHRKWIFLTCVIIRKPSHFPVSGKLLLRPFKSIHVDDCLMGVLHKVLW